ncbi:hypothetical protein BJ138DRAFT_1076328 [Hygrophoropsis aurantiaca]|uniref:Uncharacterized protein n=1 Tax=Hygrophoropsis aurantiaca TaxID=72124 RepID=A0ACB8ARQ3_9AGAM|nr:hypothetical protein BJ138DRAFT_1076328 [Hygrophoropsis aurantiaca]
MPLTLLASVSLLTLVVTSRPILPPTEIEHISTDLHSAVQAVFHVLSRGGNRISAQSISESDGLRVELLSVDEQNHALSQLDVGSVKATVSLDSETPQTDEEKLLSKWLGSLNDLDGGLSEEPEADLVAPEQPGEDAIDTTPDGNSASSASVHAPYHAPSRPVLVIVFSCVAALLALGCTMLGLYIAKYLRSQVLASRNAWELLPRLEKRSTVSDQVSATVSEPAGEKSIFVQDLVVARHVLLPPPTVVVGDSEKFSHVLLGQHWDEDEELDEKFHDALDLSPLPPVYELPSDTIEDPEQHDDPPLPAISVHPPASPSSGMNDCNMIELRDSSSSPVSRPAWSLRAAHSPAMGVLQIDESAEKVPQPIMHPRRRAYRYAVPELDIALAMQLRPGLGIGADPAWMVRFLMAVYGWFAVALTGHR